MKNQYADMTESELNAIAANMEEENLLQSEELELRISRPQYASKEFDIIKKKIALLKARANLARVIAKEKAKAVAKK